MVFTNLEKTYDRVLREVLKWMLMRKEVVSKMNINLTQEIYEGSSTNVKNMCGVTAKDFNVRLRKHQGLALSPYLFSVIMDKVTKEIQGEILW